MMALQANTLDSLPLPPLLALSPNKRRPPQALIDEIGLNLATFVHNYQEAGPIYRYLDWYEGKVKTVLLGVEANHFMTHHTNDYLSARLYRQRQSEELESDKYVVAMDGEEHYRLRKLLKQGYSRSVLDDRYPELVEIVRRQARQLQPGQPISVKRFMQQVLTEQIGATILNYPTPDRWQDICFYIDMMLAMSFVSQNWNEERLAAYRKSKKVVMEVADEIIAAHRRQPLDDHRPDLVDDLLAAAAQDSEMFSEQDLRIGVLTPYIAGINPVAHTCTFMLFALLKNADALQQIVAEADSLLAGEPPSPHTLRKMESLRCAVLEALRMYPFAPVLQMIATKAFEFGGYLVQPNTIVVINTAVSHFLPELYPNPLKFDIERYRPEQASQRPSGSYTPYGAGPHLCLGAGYSEAQMMLVMATLLATVELEIDSSADKPLVGVPGRSSFAVRVVKQRG